MRFGLLLLVILILIVIGISITITIMSKRAPIPGVVSSRFSALFSGRPRLHQTPLHELC